MNQKDLKILSYLRLNARMPLTKMSKCTSIPISTIFDRIKIFQENVVRKHTSLLDFSKLGYATRASILLSIEKEDREGVKNYLETHQSINSVFKVNNGFDFMVEGVFRQIKDMEDFLDALDSKFKVKDKKSYYIIDEVKREAFLSDPQLII